MVKIMRGKEGRWETYNAKPPAQFVDRPVFWVLSNQLWVHGFVNIIDLTSCWIWFRGKHVASPDRPNRSGRYHASETFRFMLAGIILGLLPVILLLPGMIFVPRNKFCKAVSHFSQKLGYY